MGEWQVKLREVLTGEAAGPDRGHEVKGLVIEAEGLDLAPEAQGTQGN